MIEIVNFYKGSEKNYSYLKTPISEEHKNGLFFATDTKRLYLNGEIFGKGLNNVLDISIESSILTISFEDKTQKTLDLRDAINLASEEKRGLLSKEDKKYINNLPNFLESEFNTLTKYIQTVQSEAKSYSIECITENLESNIKEAYRLIDEDGNQSGKTIYVYKDSSLKAVELDGQILRFTYILDTGEEKQVEINISEFLAESEFKDGLSVENGIVKVKIDSESEEFISVSENGIKLFGIKDALETVKSEIVESFETADKVLKENLESNWKIKNISDSKILTLNDGNLSITISLDYVDGKIYLKGSDGNISEIDASDFIKDGMLENVEVIEATVENPIEGYTEGTYLKFIWNNDGQNKVTYIEASKIGKIYSGSDSIDIDSNTNIISLKSANADLVQVKEIPVGGTPLADILLSNNIKTINSGNLQNVLENLFSKNNWPENPRYVLSSSSPSLSMNAPTLTYSPSSSVVEVGSNITFTGKANNASASIKLSYLGFDYGYSETNDNSKDGNTPPSKTFNAVQDANSNYAITLDGESTNEKTITANIGKNSVTCEVTSPTFTLKIEPQSKLYVCSSLENTSEDKTIVYEGQEWSLSEIVKESTQTVTGVYPVYTNVNTTTSDNYSDVRTKIIQNNSVFVVPFGIETNVFNMFAYPATHTLEKVEILNPMNNQYSEYSDSGYNITEITKTLLTEQDTKYNLWTRTGSQYSESVTFRFTLSKSTSSE